MIFLDRQKMFGAVKISCSPLTFVLTFFQTQKDKLQSKIHPPIPSEEVPPSRKQSWTSAGKVSPGQPSAVAEELRPGVPHDDGVSLRVRLKHAAPGAGHSWEKNEETTGSCLTTVPAGPSQLSRQPSFVPDTGQHPQMSER
ncbi:uncharacterized protein LOC143694030 isoform X1 [Agelaius phoeniceus]|uniref:uncharacterized protein LOC143694030 isoform X1 n=1 Tax=Agelaius phoeniceus TaxID=39638 RepID=UPI004054EEE4